MTTHDRAGLLAHLMDRYHIPGHLAAYRIEDRDGRVRLTFSYWTVGRGGRASEERKVITADTLEEAVDGMRRKLTIPTLDPTMVDPSR